MPCALSLLGWLKALKSPWRSNLPHIIPPGPSQPDLHNCLRQVWGRQAPCPAAMGGPGGSALCWVLSRERMGSVHEDQGRALPCRALRLQAALQVPLDQHLSYLWAPRGPSAVFDRFLLSSQRWVLCRFIVGHLKPP